MLFCDNKVHRMASALVAAMFVVPLFLSCSDKAEKNTPERDENAEQMLSGIWLNEDDNSIAFRAENDTVYYPDSTSMPMHFRIMSDTLYLDGSSVITYPIVKQTEHLFMFKNNAGDVVRLVKSNDKDFEEIFDDRQSVSVLNQNKVVKTDTAVVYDDNRYHSYTQVNPTSYKVIRSSLNNDGVMVDNVYYDNIVHISIYRLANQIFSKDFSKDSFKKYIPDEFYNQGILSDMKFLKCNSAGFHYNAVLYIPDTMTSFLVHVTVSFDGKLEVDVNDKKMN